MTSPFLRFPDVQRVLVDDLQELVGAGHTGTETPEDLLGQLPFIRVLRAGGGSDRVNDYPAIDVDVFASTYIQAERLAEQARQRILGPPPTAVLLDRAVCEVAPRELPWGDGHLLRRFGATYVITTRRRLLT